MARQDILNGESGLNVRNALNAMFTELYNAISPKFEIPGASTNQEASILENTYVAKIMMRKTPGSSGTPNVTIGLTGGGNDIMEAADIPTFAEVDYKEYFLDAANIFFTITGGTVDIVIIQVLNIF